jgi:hypothetical protein
MIHTVVVVMTEGGDEICYSNLAAARERDRPLEYSQAPDHIYIQQYSDHRVETWWWAAVTGLHDNERILNLRAYNPKVVASFTRW